MKLKHAALGLALAVAPATTTAYQCTSKQVNKGKIAAPFKLDFNAKKKLRSVKIYLPADNAKKIIEMSVPAPLVEAVRKDKDEKLEGVFYANATIAAAKSSRGKPGAWKCAEEPMTLPQGTVETDVMELPKQVKGGEGSKEKPYLVYARGIDKTTRKGDLANYQVEGNFPVSASEAGYVHFKVFFRYSQLKGSERKKTEDEVIAIMRDSTVYFGNKNGISVNIPKNALSAVRMAFTELIKRVVKSDPEAAKFLGQEAKSEGPEDKKPGSILDMLDKKKDEVKPLRPIGSFPTNSVRIPNVNFDVFRERKTWLDFEMKGRPNKEQAIMDKANGKPWGSQNSGKLVQAMRLYVKDASIMVSSRNPYMPEGVLNVELLVGGDGLVKKVRFQGPATGRDLIEYLVPVFTKFVFDQGSARTLRFDFFVQRSK